MSGKTSTFKQSKSTKKKSEDIGKAEGEEIRNFEDESVIYEEDTSERLPRPMLAKITPLALNKVTSAIMLNNNQTFEKFLQTDEQEKPSFLVSNAKKNK